MKKNAGYPVILTPDGSDILVEVPDLEILTQGKDTADAIRMAREAIELKCAAMMEDGTPVPATSRMDAVDAAASTFGTADSVVTLVETDLK